MLNICKGFFSEAGGSVIIPDKVNIAGHIIAIHHQDTVDFDGQKVLKLATGLFQFLNDNEKEMFGGVV